MSTDRELLELAAKAAGLPLGYGDGQYFYCEHGPFGASMYGRQGNTPLNWNPLTDDGDALRLAVHIGLIVNAPSPISTHATVKFYDIEISEPVKGCRFAATRRAIVRAAAEHGKTLP